MTSNVSDSFPQTIQVGDLTVHKLKLSEYALVLDKLQKVPEMIGSLGLSATMPKRTEGMTDDEFNAAMMAFRAQTQADNEKLLASLPRIVATALPEVIAILAISTRTTEEELDEKLNSRTAVQCLKAIFTLNDFFGLWEEIQTFLPSVKAGA